LLYTKVELSIWKVSTGTASLRSREPVRPGRDRGEEKEEEEESRNDIRRA